MSRLITAEKRREIARTPDLWKYQDDQVIVGLSQAQIAQLAALPEGSVFSALSRAGVRPIEAARRPGYRAGDLKQFCTVHREAAMRRIIASCAQDPKIDPTQAVRDFFESLHSS